MYLRNLHIRNVGPLEKLDIELELQVDFNPKPVILVGKNGSGKTYTLSYIADAFYELAKKEFSDVVNKTTSMDSPYFRVISGQDINTKTNSQSAAVYLRFTDDQDHEEIHYCEKIGKIDSAQELLNLYANKINNIEQESKNDKKILAANKDIKKIFSNIIVFFQVLEKLFLIG